MQLLRKIIFYLITVAYVVLCPLLIMYALGYIYKPGADKEFVTTGVIYLSTAPSGATVNINGKPVDNETPTLVRALMPGKYNVAIALDKYKGWEGSVPVEAEKATVLDKVLLLPSEWKKDLLLEGPYEDIIPVPGNDFFLVKKGPTAGDIQVCDYREGKAWTLLPKGSPYQEHNVVSYRSVENSPFMLFRVKLSKEEKLLWVAFKDGKNTVKDITELFQKKSDFVKWQPQQEDDLFVFGGGDVDHIKISTGAVYPGYARGVKGYGLYDNEVYILKDDNVLRKKDYNGKNAKTLLKDAALGDSIFGEKGFFHIRPLTGISIVFLGEDGKLLMNRLPYQLVEEGVRGVEFYPQLSRALIWTKNRIGIVDFSEEKTGNVEFEKGPGLLWAYSGGSNISQGFWVYNASHILFRDGEDVVLVAIESYGAFEVERLFKAQKGSAIYYAEETGEIYFLGPEDKNLHAIRLVPSTGIIPDPFPEMQEEKKKNRIEEL